MCNSCLVFLSINLFFLFARYLRSQVENVLIQTAAYKESTKKLQEKAREIQRRLNLLQNVGECNVNRIAIYHKSPECGYGCRLHHLVIALMLSYGQNRTLILDDDHFLNGEPFEKYHLPLSKACMHLKASSNWWFLARLDLWRQNVPEIQLLIF